MTANNINLLYSEVMQDRLLNIEARAHLHRDTQHSGEPVWLSLVTTRDGHFFIESDKPTLWSGIIDIFDSFSRPYVPPRFFLSQSTALAFAGSVIAKKYGIDIAQWLSAL